MIKPRNSLRLSVSGGTKPGRGEPWKPEHQWPAAKDEIDFCLNNCPRPGRPCGGACKYFQEKFGRRY